MNRFELVITGEPVSIFLQFTFIFQIPTFALQFIKSVMSINSPGFISKLKRVLFLIVLWEAAAFYVSTIQFASILMALDMMSVSHDFRTSLPMTLAEVFVGGIFLASIEVFYFTDRFKEKSFGYAVLIKSFFYAASLTVISVIVAFFQSSEIVSDYMLKNILSTILITFFIWGPIFIVSIFLLQVSDKYGQGVLLKFLSGKYHSPKQEIRIFMFLDLKSSTTIAEALGSVKYFRLLNDFFYDVTGAIIEAKGEIYQYVGDKIVISWTIKNGVEKMNALKCYFNIAEIIKKDSQKYQEKYGLVPSFKAGMHFGEVTVGEVGVLKRDITFSGDVLNTTSRIQEFCNKYNEKLIVSKNLLELFVIDNTYTFREIGQMNLRGKAEPVTLFGVRFNR